MKPPSRLQMCFTKNLPIEKSVHRQSKLILKPIRIESEATQPYKLA